MRTIYVMIFVFIIIAIRHFVNSQQDAENKESDNERKDRLKLLIENRDDRTNLKELDDIEFWELIERSSKRSIFDCQKFIQEIQKVIKSKPLEYLVELDNKIISTFKELANEHLLAASRLCFKNNDIYSAEILMNIFLSQGQVFFNQACLNPNLMIGKNFGISDGITLRNIIETTYFDLSDQLIPLHPSEEIFDGILLTWTTRELPSKYSELWNEFA